MNISFFAILKSIELSCSLNGSFVHNFVTLNTGHLKNIGSLSYAVLPNIDTLHHIIPKKIIFTNITYQKSFYVSGNYQAHSYTYKFSKILIFIWKLEFYYWQENTVNCCFWSDRITLLMFKKLFVPYLRV